MVKSKKWYVDRIKVFEHALTNLHNESSRLADVFANELPEFYKANAPLKKKFDKIKNDLENLKDEYSLYYR